MRRTEGARGLAKLGMTFDAIGKKLGVSAQAVHKWSVCESRPSPRLRIELAAKFGIATESWDVEFIPALPSSHPQQAEAPQPLRSEQDLLSKSKELENMIYRLMARIDDDDSATYLEQSKALSSCAQTLSILAKVTGQFDLGKRIFQLPQWKQITKAFERALADHPEAAAALAIELRKLDVQAVG